jgi:hypothetical protein
LYQPFQQCFLGRTRQRIKRCCQQKQQPLTIGVIDGYGNRFAALFALRAAQQDSRDGVVFGHIQPAEEGRVYRFLEGDDRTGRDAGEERHRGAGDLQIDNLGELEAGRLEEGRGSARDQEPAAGGEVEGEQEAIIFELVAGAVIARGPDDEIVSRQRFLVERAVLGGRPAVDRPFAAQPLQ